MMATLQQSAPPMATGHHPSRPDRVPTGSSSSSKAASSPPTATSSPPQSQDHQQNQHAQHQQQQQQQHAAAGSNSALEITYSTISPKVEQQPSPYPMMNIKLNLIDQNPLSSNVMTPNGDAASCESPFPMTPLTPGGSTDLSKKQRHNLREQRRILRISNQFDILRGKLENAGYSSTKKDKYSVLQATLEYISQLEQNQIVRNGSSNGGGASTAQGLHPHHAPHPSPTNHVSAPPRLTITAPDKSGQPFMIDSMPSPVPALSMPNHMQFPMNPMESNGMYPGTPGAAPQTAFATVECIEGSSATYRDVFANSSMPTLLEEYRRTATA
ncbi:hypothetical protein P43SY_007207 [Pythium insidiosum]|uniref:BHLH domain-containing protein n=1 Tax=Pythium insidiosum TaxID=114742 RepID=A0AAD5M1N0_PYTIN|nr:hypothetical protein P43SY_007207 [Pythium insidiosum]